jgi:hypothetical protein
MYCFFSMQLVKFNILVSLDVSPRLLLASSNSCRTCIDMPVLSPYMRMLILVILLVRPTKYWDSWMLTRYVPHSIRVGFVYASDMKYSCRQGKAG